MKIMYVSSKKVLSNALKTIFFFHTKRSPKAYIPISSVYTFSEENYSISIMGRWHITVKALNRENIKIHRFDQGKQYMTYYQEQIEP